MQETMTWSPGLKARTALPTASTTPMLLKTVQSKKLEPKRLITHRFRLDQILDAYETFGAAAKTHALKVLIEA